ncbi:MAG: DNA replication protein [Alphaproteobacteria bacterium]|nr:DNA replication protein [Alphaproteobacteria bacterium]
MTQLSFSLPSIPALGREDFLESSSNAEALAWIERWPDWPAQGLVLAGPAGSGKTHLAHIFAARTKARFYQGKDFSKTEVEALEGLSVVIEDCQENLDETGLFHLLNLAKESGGSVLFTAREPQARWKIVLPDLRSRLLALPLAELKPPDDALLMAVLAKLFADRQVRVGAEALAYILGRIERSFAAARDLVDRVDRQALAAKRPITVPLIREILEMRHE